MDWSRSLELLWVTPSGGAPGLWCRAVAGRPERVTSGIDSHRTVLHLKDFLRSVYESETRRTRPRSVLVLSFRSGNLVICFAVLVGASAPPWVCRRRVVV